MESEKKDIKIPIKAIVEQAMAQNGCKYEEDEFNLLRKYFIACLNLGFLVPDDLTLMMNKFASKVKLIVLNYNNINRMDYYLLNAGVLYISDRLKYNNFMFYQINFYKAVTEVIFDAENSHIGLSSAICNMVAEKVYNMDVNESRIIMPRLSEEKINNDIIKIRAGYYNYNLTISLAKQLFISLGINENKLIKDMYFNGFDKVINENIKDSNSKLLIEVLDKLTIMYINRRVMNDVNPGEKSLLDKYQIMLNETFTKVDQNYLAFCALITTDELRSKLMKKFNIG